MRLGLSDHLVGITHDCDYSPEVAGKSIVVRNVLPIEQMSHPEIDAAVIQRMQSRLKSCSNCGVSFMCGPAAGKDSCWCEELPHVSLVAGADQDCLCPECLSDAISKLSGPGADTSNPLNPTIASPPALVEGEDYYCEGPAIVFTASYLLRRGYCCESGCRHCPYETARH